MIEADTDRGEKEFLTTGRRYLSQTPVSRACSGITASGATEMMIAEARTEVSCGELILETHLGGYYDRLAAAEHRNAICGLGGDEDMLTATAATRATRGSAMEAHASGRGS